MCCGVGKIKHVLDSERAKGTKFPSGVQTSQAWASSSTAQLCSRSVVRVLKPWLDVTLCVPNATIYQHPNQRVEELIVHSLRGETGLSDRVEKRLNTTLDLCKLPLGLTAALSIMSSSYICFHLDSSSYPA